MHVNFADWYRAASIEPTSDLLEKRWSGLEAVKKDLAKGSGCELVRVSYGDLSKAEYLSKFRAAFKGIDSAFPMVNNNQELQTLATSLLMDILESRQSTFSIEAALAILARSWRGAQSPSIIPTLVPEAHAFVHREAIRTRLPASSSTKSNQMAFTPLAESPTPEEIAGTVNKLGQDIVKLLAETQTSRKSDDQVVARNQAIDREELDILWWVFGGHSREGNREFSTLAAGEAALMAAGDLAEITKVVPGPASSEPFLEKILGSLSATEVSLSSAVNSSPTEWRAAIAERHFNTEIADLTPVLSAIKKSTEVGNTRAWTSLFESVCRNVRSSAKLTAAELSSQCYAEILLTRTLAN